jgi:hypothetical protein
MSVSGCHVFPYIFDKLYFVDDFFASKKCWISLKLLSVCHFLPPSVLFLQKSISPNVSSIQVDLRALSEKCAVFCIPLSHVANRNKVVKSYSMFEAECFRSAAFK